MNAVQIRYNLASIKQVEQVFKRFYPAERFTLAETSGDGLPTGCLAEALPSTLKLQRYYTSEELDRLALDFARLTADEAYSVAELQGYLLTTKWDPQGAVDGLSMWIKHQEEEKARIEEAKQKKRSQAAQRRQAAKELHVGKLNV